MFGAYKAYGYAGALLLLALMYLSFCSGGGSPFGGNDAEATIHDVCRFYPDSTPGFCRCAVDVIKQNFPDQEEFELAVQIMDAVSRMQAPLPLINRTMPPEESRQFLQRYRGAMGVVKRCRGQ